MVRQMKVLGKGGFAACFGRLTAVLMSAFMIAACSTVSDTTPGQSPVSSELDSLITTIEDLLQRNALKPPLLPDEGPAPALWEVSDEDTTITLLGTIHVLPPDRVWLTQRLLDRFDRADRVYFESTDTGEGAGDQLAFLRYSTAPPDEDALSLLTEEEKDKFDRILEPHGVEIASFRGQRGWFAAIMISYVIIEEADYVYDYGVESVLEQRLLRSGRKVHALEVGSDVAKLMGTLPREVERAMMLDGLDEAGSGRFIEELEAQDDAWARGDVEYLESTDLKEMQAKFPMVYDLLLVQRNANWIPEIVDLMETFEGEVFIAVGAAHLAGDDSVQAMLEAKGYEVKRVQ